MWPIPRMLDKQDFLSFFLPPDLVTSSNVLVVALNVDSPSNVWRLLLDGHHQVQGLVVKSLFWESGFCESGLQKGEGCNRLLLPKSDLCIVQNLGLCMMINFLMDTKTYSLQIFVAYKLGKEWTGSPLELSS